MPHPNFVASSRMASRNVLDFVMVADTLLVSARAAVPAWYSFNPFEFVGLILPLKGLAEKVVVTVLAAGLAAVAAATVAVAVALVAAKRAASAASVAS